MLICDLCRQPLKNPYTELNKGKSHICDKCVKICVEIVKDPKTGKVTFLNEYREIKERERGF